MVKSCGVVVVVVVAHEILLSALALGVVSILYFLFYPRSQVPGPRSQVPSPSPSRLTIYIWFLVKWGWENICEYWANNDYMNFVAALSSLNFTLILWKRPLKRLIEDSGQTSLVDLGVAWRDSTLLCCDRTYCWDNKFISIIMLTSRLNKWVPELWTPGDFLLSIYFSEVCDFLGTYAPDVSALEVAWNKGFLIN